MSSNIRLQGLLDSIKAVKDTSFSNSERQQLLLASQKLQAHLETTWDSLQRCVWIYPALNVSLKVLVDLKLFEKWTATDAGPKTAAELAQLVNADPALLVRLLRVVAANHLIATPEPNKFEMTKFTKALADPGPAGSFNYLWWAQNSVYQGLPSYLAYLEYQNPTGKPTSAAWTWGKTTRGDFFDYLKSDPAAMEDFKHLMAGYTSNMSPWTEMFPTEELLSDDPHDVLVVDLGGGLGQDLMHMARKHSLLPHQLVLQDMDQVVADVKPLDALTPQVHDFFTPQPVKGARAYYFHAVIHDWPDAEAAKILSHVRDAMGPHSRVLIHDIVLGPQENSALGTQSDVLMMAYLNALERTEADFERLADMAGLRVEKIYRSPLSPQAIVELRAA